MPADPGILVNQKTRGVYCFAVSRVKFDQLAQVLKGQLPGVKVYKVGDEAEKQAFVVGKTGDGQWAEIKTSVVET